MKQLILKRLLQLGIILLSVSVAVFLLVNLAPGDPAYIKLSAQGETPTNERVEEERIAMGLDQPLHIQYFSWLGQVIQGDFGSSYRTDQPVINTLLKSFPYTLVLALAAFIVMLLISVPLGVLTAVKENSLVDYFIRVLSFFSASLPEFWLALILLYLFALQLKWLPVMGNGELKSMIIPAFSLGVVLSGKYIRQIRTALLEELDADYALGARTRGLTEKTVMYAHIMRNASISILTMLAMSFGALLGGTAVIENMFMWPGMGRMIVEAITWRDIPVIQGFALFMAGVYCLINLMVDLSYGLLDPRIKIRKESGQ